jgi:hypothetical protein
MWPYWLMFLLPAWAALNGGWWRPSAVTGLRPLRLDGAWLLTIVAFSLLIGFRFRVGGDWIQYFVYLADVEGCTLGEVLQRSDPGYRLLNWLSVQAGWDIYGVNLLGGLIFSAGLAVFCRSLPRPWLALAVAVPYMVIVVAMGYSRQGIALGLAMLGLVALGRRSTAWFVIWVLLAATFHKTAVIMLPVAALAAARNRYWAILWVGAVFLGAYEQFLDVALNQMTAGYMDARM